MKRDLRVWISGITICSIPMIVVPRAEAQNRLERAAECLKDGDSKTSSKLAKRVVSHAAERWELADWATPKDRDDARDELYDFLKWKLGGPSAICAQYISTGDGHFKRGHSDEAAAALVGMKLPGDGRKSFAIPRKVAHKLAEEALFGAIWTACTGLEAMPSTDQMVYGKKIKGRDIKDKPLDPYSNNPSDQNTPRDPSVDPNRNKTAIHSDANAGPQDMKECEEKARKAAQGAADYIITGDVGFDIPATQRFDVKDKLLNALILSYRYRRLDAAARDLITRAVDRYDLAPSGSAVAAAAVNVQAVGQGPGVPATLTSRDQLVALLYRLYRREKVSPATILGAASPFVPEAAAARVGVEFIVDQPATSGGRTVESVLPGRSAPPFALVPAELATQEVAGAFKMAGVAEATPGAEILVRSRIALAGGPVTALVRAYKEAEGIPHSADPGRGRATDTPSGVRPRR